MWLILLGMFNSLRESTSKLLGEASDEFPGHFCEFFLSCQTLLISLSVLPKKKWEGEISGNFPNRKLTGCRLPADGALMSGLWQGWVHDPCLLRNIQRRLAGARHSWAEQGCLC